MTPRPGFRPGTGPRRPSPTEPAHHDGDGRKALTFRGLSAPFGLRCLPYPPRLAQRFGTIRSNERHFRKAALACDLLIPAGVSSPMKPFLAISSLIPIVLVSAAACGGSALENRSGGAGSNGLAGAGSATGGSNSSGGSENAAGAFHAFGGQVSGQAGSTAGGSVGRAGAGSAGEASGGSGGVDVAACTSNTQCEVVPASCCSCGILGPAENFTAINSANRAQFNTSCAAVDCAASCPPMRAPEPNDPYFYLVATCQRPPDANANAPGRCVVVDLRKTEITACKSASDCSLRSGTNCCSGCNGMPVALNGNQGGALSDLVCPSEPVGCPACAPIFEGYAATCTDRRCSVVQML